LFFNSSMVPNLVSLLMLLNFWCLLCCIFCNTHIDLLLVKCLAKRKLATEPTTITGTIRSLQICIVGSLVACILGPIIFTFWVMNYRQEWFPTSLMYVCSVLSYPQKSIHIAFQIRFQTLISDMMMNDSKVVLRPVLAGNSLSNQSS
jgi:hypothetical protein